MKSDSDCLLCRNTARLLFDCLSQLLAQQTRSGHLLLKRCWLPLSHSWDSHILPKCYAMLAQSSRAPLGHQVAFPRLGTDSHPFFCHVTTCLDQATAWRESLKTLLVYFIDFKYFYSIETPIEHHKLIKCNFWCSYTFWHHYKNFTDDYNQQPGTVSFLSLSLIVSPSCGKVCVRSSEHNYCSRREETSCERHSPAGSCALPGEGRLRERRHQLQTVT